MKIRNADGSTFTMPDPKTEPTQELLGNVYDDLEAALELTEALFQMTFSPDYGREVVGPLRSVLEVAQVKLSAAKDRLHDTIAWCPS